MYLNLNIIFIILLYQCISTYSNIFNDPAFDVDMEFLAPKTKGINDCAIPISIVDYNMPIPFSINTDRQPSAVIHPDRFRVFHWVHLDTFKMSCAGSKFVAPIYVLEKNVSEITVQCRNATFIRFEEEDFEFDDFRCEKVPSSVMKITQERCQNMDHRVVEIGFQTEERFLKLYSLCYHLEKKTVLFSWYLVECPLYIYRQLSKQVMYFNEPELLEEINPKGAYEDQKVMLGDIINSTHMAKSFIHRVKGTRFFAPGFLTSQNSFVYKFEQQATFYYENSVPQWYIFHENLWKHLDRVVKQNLVTSFNKHVIVTGTHETCTLPNEAAVEQPLYLQKNNTMNVPLYIWKMDYDLERKEGIVYIGLNNPYMKAKKKYRICKTTKCPKELTTRPIDKQLLYCCTKDSFEFAFGKIDMTVYREFDFYF